MQTTKISDTLHKIIFKDGRELFLIGTAHISQNSVEEVSKIIEEENPDRICIELDDGRMKRKSEEDSWKEMDIKKVFKEGKGFLLLANTALASFQKKMGEQTGISPGSELLEAAELAKEKNIPLSLCDREIQITFKRAWAKSSFFNKCKLLATLISAAFSKEEISAEDLEELKKEETLDGMISEVAKELPSVKEVLIDERDRYLATKIYTSDGNKKVAVIGAGHTFGILRNLEKLDNGEQDKDLTEISTVPQKSVASKIAAWIVPALIVLLIVLGIVFNGWDQGIKTFLYWIIINATSTLIFTALGGGAFFTCILSAITAPFFALNPVLGVGMFAGIIQATEKKPKVKDFEDMNQDALKLKGWYKNRILRCLLVFVTSSLGSILGSLVAFPLIIARL